QVTWLVRSSVVLSVKVPVAVNCSVSPLGTDGFAGVTAMETSAAGVTVSTVEPLIFPIVAVILNVPIDAAVARPAALIGAVACGGEFCGREVQVTWSLTSSVEPSVNVPVAVNAWVSPFGTLGLLGDTAIETSAAGLTVRTVEPEMPLNVALMLEVP